MKWVTNWANAISVAEPKPEGYAKDITLRYPIFSAFDGSKMRIHLQNITGKETVHFQKITVAKTINEQDIDIHSLKTITFHQQERIDIQPGESILSDEIDFPCKKGEFFTISMYFSDYTSMRAGVSTSGPLSKGFFAYNDQCEASIFPHNTSKPISTFYFLDRIDVYTDNQNKAILCFGDSITAQAWPEYLQLKLWNQNFSIPRRAISGSRVLREYNCTMYETFGSKSATRFPLETEIEGCDVILVLQGVNDIIHPVGIDANPYRPMTDLPTPSDLIKGYRNLIRIAKEKKMKIFIGTILPIKGYKTYAAFREDIRKEVNHWIRTTNEIDGFIDFDKGMKNPIDEYALNPPFDCQDHLHPSNQGHKQMAETVYETLKAYNIVK